jgi:threonine synthase
MTLEEGMKMERPSLECVRCGREFPINLVNARCKDCDEPLEVRYDLGSISRDWFTVQRAGPFFERYAPFYSYLKTNPSLSLGEGGTSLIGANHLSEKLRLEGLFFKNETQNPTWTFKDRGTALSLQNAVSLGYRRIGTLSSGNMGASVAAFGSRAGLDTLILLKENVSHEKIDALAIYGGKAIRVSGNYGHVYPMISELGNRFDIYFSISDEPIRVEGYKSLAFEICEQMTWEPPDYVALPIGSGGLCRGVLKGFEELHAVGIVDTVPRFIGVQTEGCSPTVDAYEKGIARIEPFTNPLTLDHVLENPNPPSGNQVIRKIRANGGTLLKVRNGEVLSAQLLLAHEGIFAQPASAVALAGVIRCVERGLISKEARVVSIITGSGLKYPPVLGEFGFSPIETSLDGLFRAVESSIE